MWTAVATQTCLGLAGGILLAAASPFLVEHVLKIPAILHPQAHVIFLIMATALPPLKNWFSIMWLGFAMNVASGIFLVLAYPTKAFTNPDFYIKLTLIGLAVGTLYKMKKQIFDEPGLGESVVPVRGRALAVWSLVLWLAVITAGRLLAYTCSYLVYGVPC